MDKVPDSFYTIAGILIFANLSALGSLAFVAFKIVRFFSRLDLRVEIVEQKIEKEVGARDMGVRLHRRVDRMEKGMEN